MPLFGSLIHSVAVCIVHITLKSLDETQDAGKMLAWPIGCYGLFKADSTNKPQVATGSKNRPRQLMYGKTR